MLNKHCCSLITYFFVKLNWRQLSHIFFHRRSRWDQMGRKCAHIVDCIMSAFIPHLSAYSKFQTILLKNIVKFKNNESSTNALMARQERAFTHFSAFLPIWARGEPSLSVKWAPKMRSPLFGVFERDVSTKNTTWAWPDCIWARDERKNCLALFLHFAEDCIFILKIHPHIEKLVCFQFHHVYFNFTMFFLHVWC